MSPFETVKQNTSARQVAEFYGTKVNKNGMCQCPFHSDKTPSMKIDNRFYCFGCNETGDAVDYVSRLFGIRLREAAIKICEDLSLEYDKTVQKTKPVSKPLRPQKSEAQIFAEAQKNIFKVLSDFHFFNMLRKSLNTLKIYFCASANICASDFCCRIGLFAGFVFCVVLSYSSDRSSHIFMAASLNPMPNNFET